MRSKGLVQKASEFASHSLGEYFAVAGVVFYRGITMQRAVERDAQNRSNYAMRAVKLSRVAKMFNDAALRYVVDNIASCTGCLLDVEVKSFSCSRYEVSNALVIRGKNTFVLESLSRCRPSRTSELPEDGENRTSLK